MNTIDQHLSALILKQRGDNRKLVDEVLSLSADSKNKIFHILLDLDNENKRLKNDARRAKFYPSFR